MRITKAALVEHIKAGRVTLAPNTDYLLTLTEGPDRGVHRIPDSRIDALGGAVTVAGDARTSGPRRLSIR